MEVELFIPCFIDQLSPKTAFNTVKILQRGGCDVLYNPKQTCCGQPAFNAGFWGEARAVAKKFLGDFSKDRYIVSPSASCVGMVKKYYSDLFPDAKRKLCKAIQSHIYELSFFLIHVLQKDYFGAELEGRAVYHDSCAGLRDCKIKEEPRHLLSKVHGLDLVEMQETDVCCGFGGTFATKFAALSAAMAQQKVENALKANAQYIISTDASCLLHLGLYIKKNNINVKTMHLADVLAKGWGEG